MTVEGQRQATPREMMFYGILEQGPRGIGPGLFQPAEDPQFDQAGQTGYGVDWEGMQDVALMTHLLEQNQDEWESENPFSTSTMPQSLSEIVVNEPGCILTLEEVRELALRLRASDEITLSSNSMAVRRLIWVRALIICQEIVARHIVHN